jgi:parallel beta-helix repeat protein/surface protein
MKGCEYFLLFAGFLLAGLLFVSGGISSANYNIDSLVVSNGGDNVSSSGFDLKTIVGMISGALSSINFLNDIGFYYTVITGSGGSGCTTCSGCNSEIAAAGVGETVMLGADISGQDGTCIDFSGKDDVTFDCDGYDIGGDGDSSGTGVYFHFTSENNTLKDCTNISGFYRGIHFYGSPNNTLINNTVIDNAGHGIYFESSHDNILINNTVIDNAGQEMRLDSSQRNILTNNTAISDSNIGIYLSTSSNYNNLTNNTGTSDSNYGIYIYSSSSYNTLINNIGTSNTSYGIYVNSYSNYNNLTNNNGTSNSGRGITLGTYSNYNTLTNNTGTSDIDWGIYLYSSSNNNLTNNTGISNSNIGIILSTSSNKNILVGNNGTSDSNIGIYLSTSSNNTLTNNTGTSNLSHGIYLVSSSNYNNLTNNTGTSNLNSGIYLSTSSSYNNLVNNTGTSNTSYGIYIRTSSNYNNLTNNTGVSELNHGLYLESVSNNILLSNTGNCTGVYAAKSGIRMSSSSYNNLTNNIGDTIDNQGIYLIGSSNNTLVNNIGRADTSYGIYVHSSSGNNLTNNTGTSNSGQGIYLASSANNNILTNNTGMSDSGQGIYISASSGNTLTNSIARSESYRGLQLLGSDYNSFSGLNSSVTSGGYGVYLNDAAYNNFTDSVLINASTDVYVESVAGSVDNIFLNCSYDSESVAGAANSLIRQWWFGVYVNDSAGAAVNGANVSGFNSSGDSQFSVLTNSSGWIDKLGIAEYVNVGGSVSYYSDWSFNASEGARTGELVGYNVSEIFNKLDNVITINDLSTYFNSQWDTTKVGVSNSTTIKLPLEADGNYNFVVRWGDDSEDTITVYNQAEVTHDYLVEGTYNVSISGTIEGWRFNNVGDKLKIIDITQWGSDLRLGNNSAYFHGCSNLVVSATDALNLTGTTDLSYMFYSATSFNGNLSSWDTSKVTDMSYVFYYTPDFNNDISGWDTSNVTTMNHMFYIAAAFNGDLSNWDTSKVTDMSYAFTSATDFNGNVSAWDTSKVTDMRYMFRDAGDFNSDLSNWDTSKVTDMSYMFYCDPASFFNSDLSNWDTSKVTDMGLMFYKANTFNRNLSNWDTSSVEDMHSMFSGATAFNGDLSNWSTSNVTTMNSMFYDAANFNRDLSNWDTSSVEDMYGVFYGTSDFNGDISGWNTSNVTTMNRIFAQATVFNGNISSWDTSNVVDMQWVFYLASAFNGSISNWNTSNVAYMGYMFTSAAAFGGDLSNWDTSNVTSMPSMFTSAAVFNSNISNWDVSNVESMHQMFHSAIAFDQDIGDWNVSKVTIMTNMFNSVTLSTENYDSLLIGWENLSLLQNDTVFSGGDSYYCLGGDARQGLNDSWDWVVTDGGLNCTLPNITDIIVINESGVVDGDIIRGDNVTINVTLEDNYGIDKVWIKVWEGIVGASSVLYEGFLTLIGAIWTVTFGTNSSFNLGEVNYTIYVNNSEGEVVNESGNFTINNFAPVINSSRIYSISNTTTHDLLGYCNGSDAEGGNFTYYYKWYKNDAVDVTGDVINDSDSEVNVDNISSTLLSAGDNWTLSCLVGDGFENSSWLNSSEVHIHQGCGVLNESGVYTLTKNINSTGICLNITTNDVVIDCGGYSINGTDTSHGIGARGLYNDEYQNLTVQNCVIGDFAYGIYYYYVSNSFVYNITTMSITTYGVYNYGSNNTFKNLDLGFSGSGIMLSGNNFTVMNVTAHNVTNAGIDVRCDNSTISNVSSYGNGRGFYLASAKRNNFQDFNVYDNFYGIYMGAAAFNHAEQNNFSDGLISDNDYGIWLDYNEHYNRFTRLNITGSVNYGIYFDHNAITNNYFYDNYFENAKNVFPMSVAQYWNITNTTQTNIMGGNFIGGNYWTVPNGVGWSDTCLNNDSDGFCDLPYNTTDGQTDYLSLAGDGGRNVTDCMTIAASGYFNLTNNITDHDGTCIIISHDDVVFDCFDYVIDGTDTGYGIHVFGAYNDAYTNVTVRNCEITDFQYGLYATYAEDSSFYNLSLHGHTTSGLSGTDCYGSNFTNITAYSNYHGLTVAPGANLRNGKAFNNSGIGIAVSDSSKIYDSESYNNADGMRFWGSDDNYIENISIRNNEGYGVYMRESDNNNFTGGIIENNTHGLWLYYTVNGNIFKELNITDNRNDPVHFGAHNTMTGNTFYNNWISDISGDNPVVFESRSANDWNISLTVGENIIEGPYFGGNYWTNPTSTGFSDDCNDSVSPFGICDDYYNLSGVGNDTIDWLPLIYYTNSAPNNVTVSLLSTGGLNLTTSDLNCSGIISDLDGNDLNVSVRWYKNSVLNLSLDYNGSYTNATEFSAILDSGNTTKNEVWNCSIRVYDGQLYGNWGNSSELEILNSLPTVSLIAPTDWNDSTNRSLEFSWGGSDDDGDSLTFEITIGEYQFEGSGVCSDDRLNSSLNEESYIPSSDLYCLHDNGFYYNWSIRAHDGVGWGVSSDVWHFNVTAEIDINLNVDEVNFGSLSSGNINDSSDDNPSPFMIDNNGNVVTNISLNSSAIWNTESGDSSYYQFKVDNVTGEEGAFDWLLSIVSWFDMPITGEVVAVGELNYSDGDDSAEVDIRLEVPGDESSGNKSGAIVFKGVLAE